MSYEIRLGSIRKDITCRQYALVIEKHWWCSNEKRLAVHRWGQGWRWDDTNKPVPAHIEKLLQEVL